MSAATPRSRTSWPSRTLLLLLACFGLCEPSSSVHAQTLSCDLGTVLNGARPASEASWLSALFETDSPGLVTLTLKAQLDVPSEFIREVALNLNPAFSPASLQFVQLAGLETESVVLPNTRDAVDLTGAGAAGGGFDLLLSWPAGNQNSRFGGAAEAQFRITGPDNLTALDFDFLNSPRNGTGAAVIAAHIQGIPLSGGGTGSGAVLQSSTIPEPTVLSLAVLGALTFLGYRRSLRTGRGTREW